jgi:hypothetical protein
MASNHVDERTELESASLQHTSRASALLTLLTGIIVHRTEIQDFFSLVDGTSTNENVRSTWQRECSSWFRERLQYQIDQVSSKNPEDNELARVFRNYFMESSDEHGNRKPLSEVVFASMRGIASQFTSDSKSLTIHDISEALYAAGLLKQLDEDDLSAYQLVFTLIGWMTQLYDPHPNPRKGCLAVIRPDCTERSSTHETWRRRNRRKKGRVVEASDTEDLSRQTLTYLLPDLGLSLPYINRNSVQRAFSTATQSDTFYSDALVASNISFYTLNRVGKITIRLTQSVCEHLDFDEQSQCLLLFAYPAFCAYMCSSEWSATLLDR